jgi:protein-disulfide isomerase
VKKLGLDVMKYEQDLSQHKYRSRIEEDFNSGIRSGVNGTPTFYINGIRHDGAPTAKELITAFKPYSK